MKKIIGFFKKLKPTKRKIMQLYFALLFNANFKGFQTGNIYNGNTKKMCVPGINCYSCPGAVGACPIGSLQGSFSADKSTIFYVGGILLLYCILFGRMICGWLCPFGLVQELLYKIKTPKLKKGPVTRVLSFFKYVVLVFFVFIVPIMYAFRDTPLPAFCKYICPAGTLEGGIGLLSNKINESYFSMLGPLFTWKFLVMVSVLVSCVFIFRMFCRFVCPLGALYGLFNKISVFGVKLEKPRCIGCDKCVKHCKMDIKSVGDAECISCGECISVCPTNAIVWKGPRFGKDRKTLPETVEGNKTARNITRGIVAVLMAAVLAGAIVFFWMQEDKRQPSPVPEQNDQKDEITASLGNEIGDLCYGENLTIVDGNGLKEETINPAETKKITVINFWGTWCTPCVAELPYFNKLAENYSNVSVIAVHTNMVSDTASAYIAEHYPDSPVTFACDTAGEGYYTQLGGRGTYPYTVVLDENGIIIEKILSALTYEDLERIVENALSGSKASLGNEVGDLCYGEELTIVDGNGLKEETINPAETKKITVVNFWGTWCTPCVAELPYFNKLAENYSNVSVIAVHTDMVSDTASAYIAEHYPDSPVTFACDTAGEGYYTQLGGRGTYPYTVVLDDNGIIVEKILSALTYEDLERIVKDAMK